ncbi:MAG: methyltransferase domain-containing protein [Saprospiraceae bacterium]|nr:methyltransferase domain-containing protein [Saprospiraceae bacterium]
MNSPIKSNKILWDSLAELHFEDPWYKLEAFLSGQSSLKSPEVSLLGSDLAGKSLLHLQCHFGLDSMSLARLGLEVTGLDFSEKAITKARELAQALGIDCTFICEEIGANPSQVQDTYDLVFTSYGVLDWLPDLNIWASQVHRSLRPGGRFIMIEFHPLLNAFDLENGKWQYPYFGDGEAIAEEMSTSYTGREMNAPRQMHSWSHSIADILQPLLQTGLALRNFKEYDYSPYDCFPNLVSEQAGRFVWKENIKLPMLIGLEMQRPR